MRCISWRIVGVLRYFSKVWTMGKLPFQTSPSHLVRQSWHHQRRQGRLQLLRWSTNFIQGQDLLSKPDWIFQENILPSSFEWVQRTGKLHKEKESVAPCTKDSQIQRGWYESEGCYSNETISSLCFMIRQAAWMSGLCLHVCVCVCESETERRKET